MPTDKQPYWMWGSMKGEVKPLAQLSCRKTRAEKQMRRDAAKYSGMDMIFMAYKLPGDQPGVLVTKA